MSARDALRDAAVDALTDKLGRVTPDWSEYTEQYTLAVTVRGKPVKMTIVHYPAGENPESYQGRAMWAVSLHGEDGRELHRPTNPEESLDLAFSVLDWDLIAAAL